MGVLTCNLERLEKVPSVVAKCRPAAGGIHRLKKRRLPAGFLDGDESVKHNRHFNPSLSRLNLIFSRQPNFLATTLGTSSQPITMK